ncbi:dTMP kinase [Kingella kingae]|uniref:Thymidylate kinase n=4 Tax=Kingella kingae TaxID=504 RepID=F5S7M2_KINKI|nr:dTMP kinase [Kingella kingae]EGK08876.1 thymidylate kinase [Kingella kingae ATCC 23330]EIC14607.1 thymidylate kinase [Kingella kingae PYKK081]MBD3614542.1 dTMP kinase [Kingella kingae]MBD3632875.1 dTMP kinase [Kingella kingae]MBD3660184.1 dTMP kinase [Kingella kingae]
MNAQFITLDGIDGAGKTTQLNVIRDWFAAQQLPVLFTREPGGTPLGEQLRNILLTPSSQVSLHTEALMMFAARRQHLEDVILPALASGTHVVSDRFTDATFAYQGGGRGLAYDKIQQLEQWVQDDLRPNLTFILDVPLEVSVARIEGSRQKDRFEQEDPAFFARVREAYLQRAQHAPERYAVINSNREKPEVKADIEAVLNRLFNR